MLIARFPGKTAALYAFSDDKSKLKIQFEQFVVIHMSLISRKRFIKFFTFVVGSLFCYFT